MLALTEDPPTSSGLPDADLALVVARPADLSVLYGLTFFWFRPVNTNADEDVAFWADLGSTMFSRSTPFLVLLFDDELVSAGAVFPADLLALNCSRCSEHSRPKSILCWLQVAVACIICEAVTLCWLLLPPNRDESNEDASKVDTVGGIPDVLRRTSDFRSSYSSTGT